MKKSFVLAAMFAVALSLASVGCNGGKTQKGENVDSAAVDSVNFLEKVNIEIPSCSSFEAPVVSKADERAVCNSFGCFFQQLAVRRK